LLETAAPAFHGVRPFRPPVCPQATAGGGGTASGAGLLAEDAFHRQLKTHKLKGRLVGSWACSAGYDLRMVFQFVQYKGAEAILLESLGTHDEVY
jgi:hypothetical protein